MATRVFKFGLRAPIENADVVESEMLGGHRYRNRLVELERERRARVRPILEANGYTPQLEAEAEAAQEEYEKAHNAIMRERARLRSKRVGGDLAEALKAAKARRKQATAAMAVARKAVWENKEIVAQINAIGSEHRPTVIRTKERECSWGTGGVIEDSHEQSRKMPLYDGSEPNDPRFVRWTGEGRIAAIPGCHTEKGQPKRKAIRVSDVFTDVDTFIRIGPSPTPRRKDGSLVQVGNKDYRTLWVRVGSEGRLPVWAKFPMLMHRQMPPDGMITRVVVSRKKIGPREVWSAHFDVDAPAKPATEKPGILAVHMGWRMMPDGSIRVAGIYDGGTGVAEENQSLLLPREELGRVEHTFGLASGRKKDFNAARDALIAALKTVATLPEWMAKATETLDQWKSQGRLAALCKRWARDRFERRRVAEASGRLQDLDDDDGDAAAYEALEAWRYHDFHLWAWECNERAAAQNSRKNLYRHFAARIASHYGVVAIGKMEIAKTSKKDSESEEHRNSTAERHRVFAAPYSLVEAITSAVKREGGRILTVSGPLTHGCHVCGVVDEFDAATDLSHTCSGCGAVWDQDTNALRIQFRSACEHVRGEEITGGARVEEKGRVSDEVRTIKWAKAMEKKRLRKAEREAARADARNVAE